MDNKDTNTTGGPERYTGEMLESLLSDMMNDPPELADDDKPAQLLSFSYTDIITKDIRTKLC